MMACDAPLTPPMANFFGPGGPVLGSRSVVVPGSGADKYTLGRCQSSEDSGSCLIVPTVYTCSPPPALFLPQPPSLCPLRARGPQYNVTGF